MNNIRKYLTEIEQFGQVIFETATVTNSVGAVNQASFCYLNEEHATFVMTLSRNTKKVIQCKLNLVKAFKEAKTKLNAIAGSNFQIPRSFSEALILAGKLQQEKELLEVENNLLETQNHELSEVVDELFDYSSIIRVAKFNGVSETLFKWQRLKAVSLQMGIKIKKAPDPRFGTKNLYSHDVWRIAYPDYKLPETTTLVIKP